MATTSGTLCFGGAELGILQGYSALFLTVRKMKIVKVNLTRVNRSLTLLSTLAQDFVAKSKGRLVPLNSHHITEY